MGGGGRMGNVIARPTLHPFFPVDGRRTRPRHGGHRWIIMIHDPNRDQTTPLLRRPYSAAAPCKAGDHSSDCSSGSDHAFGCWRGTCSAGAWGPRRSTSTVTLGLALLGRALFGLVAQLRHTFFDKRIFNVWSTK